MSSSSKIAYAVSISWLSRLVTILANLFLLPILFRLMNQEELGLWFLLSNSHSFIGLLGFGIIPTLTRHIALAKGKSGSDPNVELTQLSKRHIDDLVVTGRIILQCLSLFIFIIAWFSGYGLINQLELKEISSQTIFWSWTFICAGYAINVWVSYLNCWLTGIGYVGWEQLISTVLAISTIIANLIAVLMGGGLLELAIISMISVIAQRFIFLGFIRWRKPELFKIEGSWNSEYAKKMIKPSLYAWLTTLGAFLILRTDNYFIALLLGTEKIPAYQAGYQLVSNLWQLSITFGTVSSVFISQSWQAGDIKSVHKIVIRNIKFGLAIMASGVAFLLISGQNLTTLWLGENTFIGYNILIVFCITLTLQTQRGILVTCSRATEDENYAYVNLIAGLLNILFTWMLIRPFGLLGVSLGTLFAQLLTNSWYGVYRPILRLGLDARSYLSQAIGIWVTTFSLCLGFSWVTERLIFRIHSSNLLVVVSVAITCLIVFTIIVWKSILNQSQRVKIIKNIPSL